MGCFFMSYVNRTTNNTQGLSALSTISGRQEDVTSTNGNLNVNIAGDIVVGDINLTKVGGTAISLGQTTMSASLPITIASDQSAIPVSQSGTWNINNISGTVSLPIGAATSALQTTGNTSLSSIDSKIPSNLTVTSTRLLVDGSGVTQPISGTVTANQGGTWNINNVSGTVSLPTGAATSTNQTNGSQKTQIVNGTGTVADVTLSNALKVDASATTQPVSGTVTANAGTGNFSTNLAQVGGSSVATAATGIQKVGLTDGTGNALSSTTGSLDVNITGGSSSGIQYAEGATTSPGTGTLAIARYDAMPPSLTDGELFGLQLDSAGNLKVTGSISVGGTTDNSSYTAGTSTGTPAMGFYHSTIDTVTDGRAATVAITSKRGQHVNLRDASGNELGISSAPLQVSLANTGANSTAVKVDGSGVTQPVSGTVSITANSAVNVAQVGGTNSVSAGVNGTLAVGGNQATNTVVSTNTNPLLIAGSDYGGTPKIQSLKVDSSGNAQVNVTNSTLAVTQSGSWTNTVTQGTASNLKAQVTGAGSAGTADSGVITVQGIASMTPVQVSQATAANLNATVVQGTGSNLHTVVDSGTITAVTSITNQVDINLKQVAGANTLAGNGTSGTGAQRVTIASDSTGQVAPAAASTATGTSIYNNTALSSTKQAVNASAGNLYGYHIYNPNSTVIYIQLFNVASASVTVGTTAPTAVIAVPAGGWADAPPATPIAFGTALTIAATTTSTGSGTPTTALLANFWYK